jgi:transformation/transcription domain-associated protein
VSKLVPWALQQLTSVKVSLDGNSAEHSGRLAVLMVMRVLPTYVEAVRPHVDAIMPVLLKIMTDDADDNAVEAMQLFTEMNKTYRSAVEQYVPAFLDFILELVRDFEKNSMARILESTKQDRAKDGKTLCISRESTRLLNDAPVMIVLIFQLHRRFINEYIPRFVPVVVQLLEVDSERPPCNPLEIRNLEDLGKETFSSSRGAFNEYISTQIKVRLFLCMTNV